MKFINFILKTVEDVVDYGSKQLKYVFTLLVGIGFGYAWAWMALN